MAEPSATEPLVPEVVSAEPELPPFQNHVRCVKCGGARLSRNLREKFAIYRCLRKRCDAEWKTQPKPPRRYWPTQFDDRGGKIMPVVIKDEATRLRAERQAGVVKGLPVGIRIFKTDFARKVELERRVKAGEDPLAAWKTIMEHQIMGFHWTKGKNLGPRTVLKSYMWFINRMSKIDGDRAMAEVRMKINSAAPKAVQTVIDIANGDFGTGKVTVKGRGENAHEEVEIDAAAANVKLKASLELLKAASGVSSEKKGNTTVNMNVAGNILQVLDGSV